MTRANIRVELEKFLIYPYFFSLFVEKECWSPKIEIRILLGLFWAHLGLKWRVSHFDIILQSEVISEESFQRFIFTLIIPG